MLKIKTLKNPRARRAIEKRAPKHVENLKKTLILHGTKTSETVNDVLMQIFHLKRDNAVRFTKKNPNIQPFESGGETSLEFFSVKTDCSLFVMKNVSSDLLQGKIGKIYMPDQQVGEMPLSSKVKGLKREWHESKMKSGAEDDQSKKTKTGQEGKDDTVTTQ